MSAGELYIAAGKLKRRAALRVDGLPPQAVVAGALEKGGHGEESRNVLLPRAFPFINQGQSTTTLTLIYKGKGPP